MMVLISFGPAFLYGIGMPAWMIFRGKRMPIRLKTLHVPRSPAMIFRRVWIFLLLCSGAMQNT